YTVKFPNM
nr:Chain C, NP205-PV epitope, YTVKFPNM [synthetic construct]3P4N_F Chain F, NP205-PV epitope, YTVKFPNM [synthetic construct]